MDCIVYGVTKSWTQLSNFHFHFSYNISPNELIKQKQTHRIREQTYGCRVKDGGRDS